MTTSRYRVAIGAGAYHLSSCVPLACAVMSGSPWCGRQGCMTAAGQRRPGLVTRLAAAMHGEVSATTVEAYRRAGAAAYQDILDADTLRAALAASEAGLWGASPAQASQLLCAWNAFVLQTLGEELVDADYRAEPRTVGFLPAVTAEQAAAFLGAVEHWSSRVRRAASDPSYDAAAEIALPAPLPAWVKAEPCPQAHLKAMMAASQAMRAHAEAALADLIRTDPPRGKRDAAARLQGMAAEADSVVAYGEALWSPDAEAQVHERAEDSLRRGIGAYFELGQLLAMPALLGRSQTSANPMRVQPLPLPGQPGFDPWCVTDPYTRPHWQQDPAACQAIAMLWRWDPAPAVTLAIQSQINAAVATGSVTPETSRGHRQHFRCPWSAIYLVRRWVTIAGQELRPMQEFTFDVSIEGMYERGQFTRQLLTGPFHPSSKADYGDPAGDHD